MSFTLTTINISNGSNAKGPKLPEKRRDAFIPVISSEKPDVTALQEVKAKKDLTEINKVIKENEDKEKGYYYHKNGGEAVVMSKVSVFQSESIRLTDADLEKRRVDDLRNYVKIRARSDIVKLTKIDDDDEMFYIVSWHGEHKIKDDTKKDMLDALLVILKGKFGATPFVLAGDFNLSYKNAKKIVEKHGLSITFDTDNEIDYFISSGVTLTNFHVYKYPAKVKEDDILDHNPLTVTVKKTKRNREDI